MRAFLLAMGSDFVDVCRRGRTALVGGGLFSTVGALLDASGVIHDKRGWHAPHWYWLLGIVVLFAFFELLVIGDRRRERDKTVAERDKARDDLEKLMSLPPSASGTYASFIRMDSGKAELNRVADSSGRTFLEAQRELDVKASDITRSAPEPPELVFSDLDPQKVREECCALADDLKAFLGERDRAEPAMHTPRGCDQQARDLGVSIDEITPQLTERWVRQFLEPRLTEETEARLAHDEETMAIYFDSLAWRVQKTYVDLRSIGRPDPRLEAKYELVNQPSLIRQIAIRLEATCNRFAQDGD